MCDLGRSERKDRRNEGLVWFGCDGFFFLEGEVFCIRNSKEIVRDCYGGS